MVSVRPKRSLQDSRTTGPAPFVSTNAGAGAGSRHMIERLNTPVIEPDSCKNAYVVNDRGWSWTETRLRTASTTAAWRQGVVKQWIRAAARGFLLLHLPVAYEGTSATTPSERPSRRAVMLCRGTLPRYPTTINLRNLSRPRWRRMLGRHALAINTAVLTTNTLHVQLEQRCYNFEVKHQRLHGTC